MDIRHVEQEDVEKVRDIALESWEDTYNHIFTEETIEAVINDWYNVESLREQTDHPIFYLAEVEQEIIGFVHATTEDKVASLHRIYLKPSYQNQGIGSKLYQKAEDEIKEKAEKIELEVLAENQKGSNFYEKQGFEQKKKETIELKGEKAVQKVMEKKL